MQHFSVRLNLTTGFFHSTDTRGSNENRGFESRTFFFEPALIGEYYFIRNMGENSFLVMKNKGSGFQSFFSMPDIYGFTGIGGLSYIVKPNDRLAQLVTKTKGFTGVIPVGAGVNILYTSYINFGVELGGQFTFSDNIDGYTSQYSKVNDIYHLLNFNFIYKIKTGQNGLPAF